MKTIFLILAIAGCFFLGCNTPKAASGTQGDKPVLSSNDTIRIANEEAEFEIIIFDPQFNSWFNSYARPRSFYTQNYLETRNRVWVAEWNNRVMQPSRYGRMYDFPINYYANTDYGFEVNYMLFNYLTYFQLSNNQQLGGFVPRI